MLARMHRLQVVERVSQGGTIYNGNTETDKTASQQRGNDGGGGVEVKVLFSFEGGGVQAAKRTKMRKKKKRTPKTLMINHRLLVTD